MTTLSHGLDYTREEAPVLLNTARAEALLEAANLDAVIATSPENVAYLSGYYCHTHWSQRRTLCFCVFVPGREPVVVSPAFEIDGWAEVPPRRGEIRLHGTSLLDVGRELGVPVEALLEDDRFIFEQGFGADAHGDAFSVLAQVIAEQGLQRARIAIDETGLTYDARERLVATLPDASVIDGAGLLHTIRIVKTEPEIERLAQAAALASRALTETMASVAPGITERELFDIYMTAVARGGGQPTFAAINAGRRTGHPHPIPSDYQLRAGDVVKYDVGCAVGLYHADIGRTQAVEHADAETERVYQALRAGEEAGIAQLRVGGRPSEVFDAAVETVRAAGLTDYRRHHVGHGIGIEIYDPPLMAPASGSSPSGMTASDEPLEPGMVVNVETPYYALGKHGMIVEDTVLITHDGCRYLSDVKRTLI